MSETPETQVKFVGKGGLMAIVVVMVILVVSNIWTYTNSQNQISTLNNEKNALQTQITILDDEKNTLQNQVDTLLNYEATHSHSNSEYSNLISENLRLESEYDILSSYYKGLSQNVSDLYDLLYSYSSIPEAFSRTLNKVSVNEISSTVWSVTGGSTSSWSSYQGIYDYITSNIEYTNDIDMPYPSTYWHVNRDGFDYITKFTMTTYRNYVQKPSLTIEIKQGNCDDQAVLAYAMIKYYMRFIFGTEYHLYIADISLSDSKHLAVILPVQGGQICVIDPASNYLTSSWGVITSKTAQSELQTYSNYWSSYGSITYMKLYDVSIQDGSYSVAAEGTINQIVTFLIQD
jgi:cell division protein FtsB